jgi:hypothetical protein
VQLAYVDQSLADLDPYKTAFDVISEGRDEAQLGKVTFFDGDFSEYEEWRTQALSRTLRGH